MKGYTAVKANLKYGVFRKSLLEFCKSNFEELFRTPEKIEKKENEKEEDRLDRELRYKHKLFGNMDFVGELFKFGLVSEKILYSIFESLFGIDSVASISDITIDAALQLINKLGSKMEQDLT